MLNRAVIHIKNLWKSLRWLKLDFNKFKDHLESRGYYSPVPYVVYGLSFIFQVPIVMYPNISSGPWGQSEMVKMVRWLILMCS